MSVSRIGLIGSVLLLTSCSLIPARPAAAPTPAAIPSPAATTRTVTVAPTPTSSPTPSPTPSPSRTPAANLVGDTRNTWAFAPLDDPGKLVVEGDVPSQRAWSTSKVLVVAAFLAEACDGDPTKASATQRKQMERSLAESDMDSVVALGNAIPGGKATGMTKVLRSIGDTETKVPSRQEGTMTWTVEQQVRFLIALNEGRVVSPETSRYLLEHMQPIESQSWGLGKVGATAYKGGWVRSNTETRQMGILDGYAVAIVTRGVGPVELQSDGDSAHVQQMNLLAVKLQQRLVVER